MEKDRGNTVSCVFTQWIKNCNILAFYQGRLRKTRANTTQFQIAMIVSRLKHYQLFHYIYSIASVSRNDPQNLHKRQLLPLVDCAGKGKSQSASFSCAKDLTCLSDNNVGIDCNTFCDNKKSETLPQIANEMDWKE